MIGGVEFEEVTSEIVVQLPYGMQRAATLGAMDGGGMEVMPLPEVVLGDGEVLPTLEALSPQELALGLRSVIAKEGGVFRQKEPAWDLVEAALSSHDAEQVIDGESGMAVGLALAQGNDPEYIFAGPGEVTTSSTADGRTMPTQSSPWITMVHLSSGCSGMYMGERTVITAAHCVVADSGALIGGIVITPFRRGEGTSAFAAPYGQHAVAGVGQIRVPAGYFSAQTAARDAGHIAANGRVYDTGMMPWDFAVIEFAAGARPVPMAAVGWNGFAVDGFTSGTARVYGYPSGGCPGSSAIPRLCGITGTAYSNGSYLESDILDATAGQSGGPWLRESNHLVGHYIAAMGYFDYFKCGFELCRRNFARKLDATVWSWIQSSSPDW